MTLSVELIANEGELQRLQPDWDELALADPRSSLFAAHAFIHCAWRHFSTARDSLFTLALRRGTRLEAVVPLRLSVERLHGVPLRTLRYIAEWEGDRPGIVSTAPPGEVWGAAWSFLRANASCWDALILAEQPADSPLLQEMPMQEERGIRLETAADATAYGVALTGTWEDYLAGTNGDRGRRYHKRLRQAEKLGLNPTLERCDEPGAIAGALERFVAVEQSGWKRQAHIGVGKSEKQRRYYFDLLAALARQRRAAAFFLRAGDTDIAAALTGLCHRRWYGLQIAFNSDYSRCSPGLLLQYEVLRSLFGAGHDEFDLLSMRGPQTHKVEWATHQRETVRIEIMRRSGRALPLLIGRGLKRLLQRGTIPPCTGPRSSLP